MIHFEVNWKSFATPACVYIININTTAIDCLWFVTLDTLHIVTLHTGAAMLCRFISRRVRVTGKAGSRRRLSVAGSHVARAGETGFLPISTGKASNYIVVTLHNLACSSVGQTLVLGGSNIVMSTLLFSVSWIQLNMF